MCIDLTESIQVSQAEPAKSPWRNKWGQFHSWENGQVCNSGSAGSVQQHSKSPGCRWHHNPNRLNPYPTQTGHPSKQPTSLAPKLISKLELGDMAWWLVSDHKEIKLEINNRQMSRKPQKTNKAQIKEK